MITSLRLVNFKNFADETLRMGPFTVIVGANASGKSNIRDAFRFLHGIGQGFTIDEIIGGKHDGWPGIRGAPSEFAPKGSISSYGKSSFSLHVELDSTKGKTFYSIKVGPNPDGSFGLCVLEEELRTESANIYKTMTTFDNRYCVRVGEGGEEHLSFNRLQPVLTQFVLERQEDWCQCIDDIGIRAALKGIQFQELTTDQMLEPSISDSYRYLPSLTEQVRKSYLRATERLGDLGEELPFVLREICASPERKRVLTDWLRELTPMDVQDIRFPLDVKGWIHLQILDANDSVVLAESASEGTLRFLGLLAVLLSPKPARLYFVEEIENGFHPSRLSLLVALIEQQTARRGIQVVTTTHSPDFLAVINEETFENTSVLYRGEYSLHAAIHRVADLPNARKLRESQGLGRLHASGWMENMLAFEEADNADQVNER